MWRSFKNDKSKELKEIKYLVVEVDSDLGIQEWVRGESVSTVVLVSGKGRLYDTPCYGGRRRLACYRTIEEAKDFIVAEKERRKQKEQKWIENEWSSLQYGPVMPVK